MNGKTFLDRIREFQALIAVLAVGIAFVVAWERQRSNIDFLEAKTLPALSIEINKLTQSVKELSKQIIAVDKLYSREISSINTNLARIQVRMEYIEKEIKRIQPPS